MPVHPHRPFAVLACLLTAVLLLGGCGLASAYDKLDELDDLERELQKTAAVDGNLASLDGQSANLDGIAVTVVGESDEVVTDARGGFRFPVRPGERIRLRFTDRRAGGSQKSEEDTGSDIDDDVVEIDPLKDGETCEVEVEIEDGVVVEACVRREDEDEEKDGAWHGAMRLVPPPDAAASEAGGEVGIVCKADGCRAVIEVFELPGPDLYEAVLDHPEQGRYSLGLIEVDAEGEGRLVIEHGADDPLPYGVESLEKLVGTKLLVLDGVGNIVLKGLLPGEGPREKDDEHEWVMADGSLTAPTNSPEPDAVGWILLKTKGEATHLVIEVGELEATELLKVLVVNPTGGHEGLLGVFEIEKKGCGRFAHSGKGDLPFDATGLGAYQGYEILLVDGEGRVVLAGEVPSFED